MAEDIFKSYVGQYQPFSLDIATPLGQGLQIGSQVALAQENIAKAKQDLELQRQEFKDKAFDRAVTNLVKAANVKNPAARKFLMTNSQELLTRAGYTYDPNQLNEMVSNKEEYSPYLAQFLNAPESIRRDPVLAQNLANVITTQLEAGTPAWESFKIVLEGLYKQEAAAAGATGRLQGTTLTATQQAVSKGLPADLVPALLGTQGDEARQKAVQDPRYTRWLEAQTKATEAKATGTEAQQSQADTARAKGAAYAKNIDSLVEWRKNQKNFKAQELALKSADIDFKRDALAARVGMQEKNLFTRNYQQTFKNLEPTRKLISQANLDLSLSANDDALTLFGATETLRGIQRLMKGPGVLTDAESQELVSLTIPKITQWEKTFRSYTGDPLKTTVPENVKRELRETLLRMYKNQKRQYDALGNSDIDNRVTGRAFTPADAIALKKRFGIDVAEAAPSMIPPPALTKKEQAHQEGGAKQAPPDLLQALRARPGATDEKIKAFYKAKGFALPKELK